MLLYKDGITIDVSVADASFYHRAGYKPVVNVPVQKNADKAEETESSNAEMSSQEDKSS